MFVGIDQSITYGAADGTTVLAGTAGVTDTGTTLLLLATGVYSALQMYTLADGENRRFRYVPEPHWCCS